ncbi:DUF6702 family protein [Candidatus Colwellia aromaticivorans]|uniref:DUF6702 family protein n=1 Tax=Candidatus Colwellia aromaticivorans TaxID=2267621 RepID=UPI000DF3ECF8|nr:DUF6702 family protein [Candidatus Colwellia aromaticivorans]
MVNSFFKKALFSILLVGVTASVAAHTYFFGLTEININSQNKHIEVIHQFTAHDIENTLAEIKQEHFSPEHPKYDQYIQAYFEKHFVIERNNKTIQLNWLGFEVKRGKLFVYQESTRKNFLTNLVVKNTLLIDTYPKQINTVNYQDVTSPNKLQGSLTYNQSLSVAVIGTGDNLNINKANSN